jgi:hypothetical protein
LNADEVVTMPSGHLLLALTQRAAVLMRQSLAKELRQSGVLTRGGMLKLLRDRFAKAGA